MVEVGINYFPKPLYILFSRLFIYFRFHCFHFCPCFCPHIMSFKLFIFKSTIGFSPMSICKLMMFMIQQLNAILNVCLGIVKSCQLVAKYLYNQFTNRFECLFIIHINLSPIHFNDINVIFQLSNICKLVINIYLPIIS